MVFLSHSVWYRLDQAAQVFGSTTHIEEYQAQLGIFARQDGEYCFLANGSPARVNYTVYDATYRLTTYPYWDYHELFDHRIDPGECDNVADRRPDVVEALMRVLQEKTLQYRNPILGRTGAW